MSTLASFTRPPKVPLPPGFIRFDKNVLAQPELAALMGYESADDGVYPIFRRMFQEVSTYAHGGMIRFMMDALQEYLQMDTHLKQLPDDMRMTDEEKVKLDGVFKAFKDVKKEFSRNYAKNTMNEVVKAREDSTDSDEDVEILKSIRI